jgi:hypothetical protein
VLVLDIATLGLGGVDERIGMVPAIQSRHIPSERHMPRFNPIQRQKARPTHLAKLSNTRSNLGDEQNSAARVMTDDAIGARSSCARVAASATLTRPFT